MAGINDELTHQGLATSSSVMEPGREIPSAPISSVKAMEVKAMHVELFVSHSCIIILSVLALCRLPSLVKLPKPLTT